mgnify:CR=1 FL=1
MPTPKPIEEKCPNVSKHTKEDILEIFNDAARYEQWPQQGKGMTTEQQIIDKQQEIIEIQKDTIFTIKNLAKGLDDIYRLFKEQATGVVKDTDVGETSDSTRINLKSMPPTKKESKTRVFRKPTKADLQLAQDMWSIVKRLNARMGTLKKRGCPELHAGCFDCQTRWLIGMLNNWIDILE